MAGLKQNKKTGRNKSNVELTEAEWAIMNVVWRNEPCAAGTVQEILAKSKDRAYSTVKTTMDRMVKKGFLKVDRIRNLQLFSSKVNKAEAKSGEFRKMLKRAFDGALTPMLQFLLDGNNLSQEQIRELETMMKNRRQKVGKTKSHPK